MSHELPKTYDPSAIEVRWAEYWVAEKLFSVKTPEPGSPEAAKPIFTLLLPPPNVTGRLHMGHMLNQTEMDIIIRWRRMRGFTTLWLPGTDHAGIATQMMVERQLASEGKSRQGLGREAFLERVWDWKKHYGGAIQAQMKRLGASVDWDREYFTMDENLSRAVTEVFVRLHEQGLIYRGKYIVNWCPRCMTAISDLEVVHEDFAGKLYQFRYPLADDPKQFVTIATTRPETMLGDTAVAVNPKDDRYRHLVGKKLRLPLMDREIPIIADDFADPQFGSGAVKVTPAHDPNDFAIGLRHNLAQINVMDDQARINENGGPYAGLDRYEAREKILRDMEGLGLLAGIKDHTLAIGKCDRCKTIVEPRLSTQWFIKIQPLADRAIEAVEKGEIKFTPENYAKTYFEWMRNIHDWCISRQLWWGHRIPAWHCQACSHITVARTAPAACEKCGNTKLTQDNDVLDTWFSSGLLPFTVFGWPEKTRDLDVFYPTTLLITGFDILFFWVARMIMLGCHFMAGHPQGSVPFHNVYIHALVRDADRQKMSKTKGNVIDPIEVTEKYGTDAVRFTLASMASPGTDIAFSESRTDGYRAFANKIWNAARFMFMNLDRVEGASLTAGAKPEQLNKLENRWIYSRFHRVAGQVNQSLADYRFDEAANTIYKFFWGEFCDWYLEIIKPALSGPPEEARNAVTFLGDLFEGSLRLLSPFMPFITEEVWHAMYDGKPPAKSIALVAYPEPESRWLNDQAEEQMMVLQDLIEKVRNMRAEMKVEPKVKTPIKIHAAADVSRLVNENRGMVERLASVDGIEFVESSLAQMPGARSTPRFEVALIYEQKVDIAAERERLTKELTKLENELANADRQLGNQQFLAKAPPQVVEGIRRRQGELHALIEKGKTGLTKLG
ncbi:MAG TPA: valine--tRNA ligase [Candidatus Dormibacteraeota bacterium]|jgi:valyl-tRNA synthetase|nr:valine--tRNA ligase [Candidatus Dormibacteraeota bacterium]